MRIFFCFFNLDFVYIQLIETCLFQKSPVHFSYILFSIFAVLEFILQVVLSGSIL